MATYDLGSFTLAGTATHAAGFGGLAQLAVTNLTSSSDMTCVFPWPDTADPTNKREPYRLVIVDKAGTFYAELENAVINDITWGTPGGIDFDLPTTDPKAEEVKAPEREVQVWRGTQLLQWCVIVRARADANLISVQGVTLEWYFGRRITGPVPRVGKFLSTGFENGIGYWDYNYLPGSNPASIPAHSPSSDVKLMGDGSLMMSPSGGMTKNTQAASGLFTSTTSSTLSSGGNTIIDGIVGGTFGSRPYITVAVYHDDSLSAAAAQALTDARANAIADRIHLTKPEALVKGYGRGEKNPVATNRTSGGRNTNRRVVFTYRNDTGSKGHLQYASQTTTIKVPASQKSPTKATFRGWVYIESFAGPAGNNYGLTLERQHNTALSANPRYAARGFHKVLSRVNVPITKATPVGKWVRMDASLNVPADGQTYLIVARMYSPSGLAYWDECDVFFDEGLRFNDEEESVIIGALVDHAQDPAMGKSTLNITKALTKTGIKRSRTYLYSEREVILDLLQEFPTLMNGAEWDIRVTPESRVFTSYYPRKGADRNYPLVLGSNIAGFSVDVDAEQTADQVVILAYESEGASREERSVSDATLLDGLILEKAYEATPGADMATMFGQAQRGIERYRKPSRIPNIISHPDHLSDILANIAVGDRVPVDVRYGWFQAQGTYRIESMSLNPQTDQITFTISEEDQKVVTLLSWNATGWRYKAQSQIAKTGDNNTLPVETDVAYAARAYDDSAWSLGQAPFGWSVDGTVFTGSGETPVNTTIPVKNEVWLRRSVLCTEEMYLVIKHDYFTYMYVNGHRVNYKDYQPYVSSSDFGNRNPRGTYRVPDEFLDPSGVQVVAMHTQDRLSDYGGQRPDAFVADMLVKGIYNPDHVR